MLNLVLAIAAGLLAAAAFEPLALWPLMLVSISLFLWTIQRARRATILSFVYGLAFFLPLLKWAGTYVGALPWIALAVLQAAFFVPLGLLVRRRSSPLTIAALWVGMEALRSRFPWGGFGWGRVAFSQVDAPTSVVASLGGAALLTFLTVLIAAGVVLRRVDVFVALLLIPVAAFLLPPGASQSLAVAAVQGNVPRLGLDFNAQREAVLNNHIQATSEIPPRSVDLIVWPENASDVDPYQVQGSIQRVVDHVDTPVLVGGLPRIGGNLFNASILWLPKSGPQSVYFKQDLAPFGEYMPLRSLAEKLVPEARRVEDFTAGNTVVLHKVHDVKVASIICFEVLNDGLIRKSVNAGAGLLVVQTNSATFGPSAESAQQLAITRLRAIEHARSIASVSTSGISALITPRGLVLAQSEIFEKKVLTAALEVQTKSTLSAQMGGWAELGLIAIPLLWRRPRR